MKPHKRRGRLPLDEPCPHQICLHVSNAMLAQLEQARRAAGLSREELMRRLITIGLAGPNAALPDIPTIPGSHRAPLG